MPFWRKEVTDRHQVWWTARVVDRNSSNHCFFVELLILLVAADSLSTYSWDKAWPSMAWLMSMWSRSRGEIRWSDGVISFPASRDGAEGCSHLPHTPVFKGGSGAAAPCYMASRLRGAPNLQRISVGSLALQPAASLLEGRPLGHFGQ